MDVLFSLLVVGILSNMESIPWSWSRIDILVVLVEAGVNSGIAESVLMDGKG